MASQPRVAIVHDWLYGGGAELVVEQLHKLYPEAPIFASFCTPEWRERLDNKVVTGWLQWRLFRKYYKYLGFLRIWWYSRLKFDNYDLVISSSGHEAKGIKAPPSTLHINYCHTPTHYYWSRYDEYMAHPGFGRLDGLARLGLRLLVGPLRKWDLQAAQRPDIMLANSTHIQAEIRKYYHRDSTVVHPPIYLERFSKLPELKLDRHGFLISGRQTPYKRFDLAVVACSKLGLSLTVIGAGPDNGRLRKLAGPTVTFLGRVDDATLEQVFGSAAALIFPGLDDFGITPVEALAAGTPVLAYKGGGALDYIVPGKTGEFFEEPTVESLQKALKNFRPEHYKIADLQAMAAEFATTTFRQNIKAVIKTALDNRANT